MIGLVQPRGAGRMAGVLFALSGVFTLSYLPALAGGKARWMAVNGVCCGVAALLSWFGRWERHPGWFAWTMIPIALAIVSWANTIDPNPSMVAVYFPLVFAAIGLLLPRFGGFKMLPFGAVAYLAPFAWNPAPKGMFFNAITTMGVSLMISESIAWVGQRLQHSEETSRQRLDGLAYLLDTQWMASGDGDPVLAAVSIAVVASSLTGADSAALLVPHEQGLELVAKREWSELDACDGLPWTRTELETIARTELRGPSTFGVEVVTVVPLGEPSGRIGYLVLGWRSAPERSAALDAPLLDMVARQSGHALAQARAVAQLRDDSLVDPLTRIGNRRRADALLVSSRPGDAVVVVDLDHFKALNDRDGHVAGDDALRNVAQFLQSEIREQDEIARWGGEEFLLVMRELTERSLESLLDRLRRMWNAHCHDLTFSTGAAIVGEDGDVTSTFAAADRALYAAKQAGRDRVVVGSSA
jgi:diguanylate cyclase (GGDEF)-like protein